tara:strand:+ start:35 stop:586 length:552 start_codon:yes stop_codon:yes gene_type:complete
MYQKNILRKKYFNLRKKRYYEIDKKFFLPLLSFIKSNFKKDNLKLALYYPTSFEINVLKLLENQYMNDKNVLLPIIEENNRMNFFLWKKNSVLLVNKYGILEPQKTKNCVPNFMLLPILAFDRNKYRLGYGKGFYDRYLNKYLKKISNIITVGVAFSFQKHHKLPIDKNDVKLDYILTEKGIH